MENFSTLTKTCSVCGNSRPIFSFREIAEDVHPTFSDICDVCRSKGTKAKTTPVKEKKDFEDAQSGIDARARKKAAESQTFLAKKIKADALDDKVKKTVQHEIDLEKKFVLKKEKTQKKEMESSTKVTQETKKTFSTDTTVTTSNFVGKTEQKSSINAKLSSIFVNPQHSEERSRSPIFQQFRAWLGGASPLGNKDERAKSSALTETQISSSKNSRKMS